MFFEYEKSILYEQDLRLLTSGDFVDFTEVKTKNYILDWQNC